MKLVFLSPHLDDAAYSCGGLIHTRLTHGDSAEVWTVCTADPPTGGLSPFAHMLHSRWGESQNPMSVRRLEDQTALEILGCTWRHLGFRDCIYRDHPLQQGPLIQTAADLFLPDPPIEEPLIAQVAETIRSYASSDSVLVAPLGVGHHIDHHNTRLAAESLGRPLLYYADFPYAAKDPQQISDSLPDGATEITHPISQEGRQAWQNAIAAYTSQLSSFWSSIDQMKLAVELYAQQPFALSLWQK